MSPGSVDPALVRRHLLALDAAVRHLRTHAGKPAEALIANRDALWAVERGLLIRAQNVLDVATHLAASHGEDTPDYTAAIDALQRLGILPAGFTARFRSVAGFRNVLVHGYLDVDPQRVHAVLNEQLDDFAEFARHIHAHLAPI